MLLMLSATAELTGAAKKMTEADIRSTVKLGNTLTERPQTHISHPPLSLPSTGPSRHCRERAQRRTHHHRRSVLTATRCCRAQVTRRN